MVAIVISPPPPRPVRALIKFSVTTSGARPHPKHPSRNVAVATKKQVRRPKMSENRPYRGWNAVLVIKYDVVNHETVFAVLNSDPITAYVAAVIVPSKPARNTFEKIAGQVRSGSCIIRLVMIYRSRSK
jgi:hypothetical protein